MPRTRISALLRRRYYSGLDYVCGAGYENLASAYALLRLELRLDDFIGKQAGKNASSKANMDVALSNRF